MESFQRFCNRLCQRKKVGVSSSGRSARHLSYETFAQTGQVELYGFKMITFPGVVKLWQALHERFGILPFHVLFEL